MTQWPGRTLRKFHTPQGSKLHWITWSPPSYSHDCSPISQAEAGNQAETYLAFATHSKVTSEVPAITLVLRGGIMMVGAMGSAGPPTSEEWNEVDTKFKHQTETFPDCTAYRTFQSHSFFSELSVNNGIIVHYRDSMQWTVRDARHTEMEVFRDWKLGEGRLFTLWWRHN